MPAEWERHEATWLAWPHNPTDWPRKLGAIRWVYGEMIRKIGPGEIVKLEPGEAADFTPLTEVTTVVVKLPCVRGDKYPGAPEARA